MTEKNSIKGLATQKKKSVMRSVKDGSKRQSNGR